MRQPAEKTKSDIRTITDFYQKSYLYEYMGTPSEGAKPEWNGKIIKLVKADLSRIGVDLLGYLIEDFFRDKPDWVVSKGAGLGYNVFHSQIDSLIERRAAKAPSGHARLA